MWQGAFVGENWKDVACKTIQYEVGLSQLKCLSLTSELNYKISMQNNTVDT